MCVCVCVWSVFFVAPNDRNDNGNGRMKRNKITELRLKRKFATSLVIIILRISFLLIIVGTNIGSNQAKSEY